MDLTRPWARTAAAACALTLLFAACGDDDDSSGDEDTEQTTEAADDTTESTEAEEESTTTAAEEETTTTESEGGGETDGDPEAVATAEAINLKIEDFAEGWVEEESDDDDGTDDGFDECFTTLDIEESRLGEAETPGFTFETPDGQGAQAVSMQTVVFDSPETATAALAEMATPEFATCTQDALGEDFEGTATLEPVVDDPPLAEESAGLAGTVDVVLEDGSSQQGRVDLHGIRTAEVVSFTFTLDIGATPATGFEQTLAELYTVISDRQAAEVG
jgi:hypothetical protein